MSTTLASIHHASHVMRPGMHGSSSHTGLVVIGLFAIVAFVVYAKMRQSVGG